MIGHGAAAMGDKNAVLAGGDLENFGIAEPADPAVRRGSEVRGALRATHRQYNAVIEVSVGLEADQG